MNDPLRFAREAAKKSCAQDFEVVRQALNDDTARMALIYDFEILESELQTAFDVFDSGDFDLDKFKNKFDALATAAADYAKQVTNIAEVIRRISDAIDLLKLPRNSDGVLP